MNNQLSIETVSGHLVTKCTTRQLAERILTTPGIVYSFATTPKDMSHANCPTNHWPWYNIVCAKLFDVHSVFINRSTIFGGAPFMFDLPDYDDTIDVVMGEEQSEECLEDMINGLNHFHEQYGVEPDTWYLDEKCYHYVATA